ncbi:MAG: hypothetical protein KIT34_05890 [Cyanobacteria bacterium TGS_CYA1]|nr:hypothetical protein [Cyanobacteria bacterium TGS_CYA1]
MFKTSYSSGGGLEIAYFQLVDIKPGGSKKQREIKLSNGGIIVMDFSEEDKLLAIEVIFADLALPEAVLQELQKSKK